MMGKKTEEELRVTGGSLRKGSGLLMMISVIGFVFFLAVVAWINWPKTRIAPEPLSAEQHSLIDRIPGNSDAIIYLGMKEIRKSRFWQEVLPDSLKTIPLFQPPGKLNLLLKAASVNPSTDIDALLMSFRRQGYRDQNFLAVASGPLAAKISDRLLNRTGTATTLKGHTCYRLDSALWLSRSAPDEIAIAGSQAMLEGFLAPTGSFFQRDSLAVAMMQKAVYKSHLWFALPSAAWTSSALESLTSQNSDVNTLGNLNRIQNLALSVRFNEGIEAESEWVYGTRRAAWFASTFLWGALKLSGLSEERSSPEIRNLLERIRIQQNLESVIIHTKLPLEIFTRQDEEK